MEVESIGSEAVCEQTTPFEIWDSVDGMPLSEENQQWVKDQICKAVHPNGFGIVAYWLRKWGILAACITGIITLISITLGSLYQAYSHVAAETTFRTNTDNRLKGMENQMVSLRALVSSNQPLKRENQLAARELIAEARRNAIPPIPEAIVEQSGKRFLDASASEPDAWKVAIDFVNYRSSINPLPPGEFVLLRSATNDRALTNYTVRSPAGKAPNMLYSGVTQQELAARVETIESPPEQPAKMGMARFVLKGGALLLDGMRLRNVVLWGVEVHYSGGKAILENVTFVNCQFVVENNQNGRAISERVLSSVLINLDLNAT